MSDRENTMADATIQWARPIAIFITIVFVTITIPPTVPDLAGHTEVKKFSESGIRVSYPSLISSEPGPAELNSEAFTDGTFAIELRLHPAISDTRFIGSVASYSTGSTYNWAIEQHGNSLVVLYRNRGVRFENAVHDDAERHFVFNIDSTGVAAYRDDQLIGSTEWSGEKADWAVDARLTIANLDTGDYPWSGTISRLRLHTSADMLQLNVPNVTSIELRSASGTSVALRNYDWRYRIKFENLFRPGKQIVDFIDILLNFLLPFILGASLAAATGHEKHRFAVLKTAITVAFLSLFVESLQFFSPIRVASLLDVAVNTLGAIVGALLWKTYLIRRKR